MRVDNLTKEEFPFWAIKEHQGYYDVVQFSHIDDRWGEKRYIYGKIMKIHEYAKTIKIEDANDGIGFGLSGTQAMRYHRPGTKKGDTYIRDYITRIFEL